MYESRNNEEVLLNYFLAVFIMRYVFLNDVLYNRALRIDYQML